MNTKERKIRKELIKFCYETNKRLGMSPRCIMVRRFVREQEQKSKVEMRLIKA